MKTVQVLLSSYNGEKYIAQQIESILNQKNIKVSLLIRDDGSADATVEIIAGYKNSYPENIRFYRGSNIGTQRSYFDLMAHADSGLDYYAFSDQDDVWLPEKLQAAIQKLDHEAGGQPLLYASEVIYASENLQLQKKMPCRLKRAASFGNALVENICMGCTEVFNEELLQLAKDHPPGTDILHDWWLYMTASCFGKVVFDKDAYILYRQHGKNQVGMQDGWKNRWWSRIHRLKQLRGCISRQAKDFLDQYGQMTKDDYELNLLVTYRNNKSKKKELIFNKDIYRQNNLDHIIYKILFLIVYL